MTQEELKTLIHYDTHTGHITLLQATTNRQKVGDVVTPCNSLNLYRSTYATLKLIALYVYGDYNIKLITLDGTDNTSLSNLFVVGSLTGVPLTQGILKTFLHFDRDTGIFTRIARTIASTQLGTVAGNVQGTLPDAGYIQISLLGKLYGAHRLAWLYEYGHLPEKQIDHINHDRTDNRIANLRVVDNHTNMKNKSLYTTNSSGYTGVEKHGNNWKARIGVNGTKVLLGVYSTYEEAVAARKAGEKLLSYHNNHGQ